MNKFIENNIEWAYAFTNHTVNNIRQDEKFNQNHLAKMLYEQCDNYKVIIDKLLKDNEV